MTPVNLKSMYNDPSQMREALAWRLFAAARAFPRRGTPTPSSRSTRPTTGLFSVIEQVDKRFLKDHFGGNHRGNLYKAYCGDVGLRDPGTPGRCRRRRQRAAVLQGRRRRRPHLPAQDQRGRPGRQHLRRPGAVHPDDQRHRRCRGGDERFDTDAFRASVDGIMNARAFLRWAAVNVLLGSWDNYFATPSNYYLYNSGRAGRRETTSCARPYFTFIPWDYDNCLGHRLLRHRMAVHRHARLARATPALLTAAAATSRIPLVQNLLRQP